MSKEHLQTAIGAARAGGELLRRRFRTGDLGAEVKGDRDFVTVADRESETAILEFIRERHPDDAVLSEEAGGFAGRPDAFEWFIDPLDGTNNFIHGLPVYAVSIGCRRGSELVAAVVFDPERDELFSARRGGGSFRNGEALRISDRVGLEGAFLATGYPFHARAAIDLYLRVFREIYLGAQAIRRCGAAALDLAYTAAGIYDGFFEFRLSAWDLAAGALLIEEAGGVVTDLDGTQEYLDSGNVIAGAPDVHRELREIVARYASESEINELVTRHLGEISN